MADRETIETTMTRDELTEAVARMIADHCCADSVEEFERDTARAIVGMVMPPPLVWREGRESFRAEGPCGLIYESGEGDGGDDAFAFCHRDTDLKVVMIGDAFPNLAAAQSAAQAHADAAHIAGMAIAQEATDD